MTKSIEKTIEELQLNAFAEFHYPNKVLVPLKEASESLKNLYTNQTNQFPSIIGKYISKVKPKLFHSGNSEDLCNLFIKTMKEVYDQKSRLFSPSELTFDLSIIERKRDIEKEEYKEWKKRNPQLTPSEYEKETGKKAYYKGRTPQFDVAEFQGSDSLTEKRCSLIREFLNNKDALNSEIIQVLKTINKAIRETYSRMIEYFIQDAMHLSHLKQIIDYQDEVESIFSTITSTGSLDTTRDIKSFVSELLIDNLKIDPTLITYYSQGIHHSATSPLTNETLFYFERVNVDLKKPSFQDGALKVAIESLKRTLQNQAISFEQEGRKFKAISVKSEKVLKGIIEEAFQKGVIRDNTKNYISKSFTLITPFSHFTSSERDRKITFKTDDLYSISKTDRQYNIEVRHFSECINRIASQTEKTFLNFRNDKPFNKVQYITSVSYGTKLSLKIFDLIQYVLELTQNVQKFFLQTLDLKPLLRKTKVSEPWGSGKGWLDVDKTIEASLNKGFLTPMETYRKKLLEDPPNLFIIFDISSSMKEETRLAQFLVLLLLSFFGFDINKCVIGYITAYSGDFYDGGDYFKSIKRKELFQSISSSKRRVIEAFRKVATTQSPEQIITDYQPSEYHLALRDFLDNEQAGRTGTNIDAVRYLGKHPDLDNRGLKYVFIFTDADFRGSKEKKDFVNICEDLIKRNDLRFLFMWDLPKNTNLLIESSDNIVEKDINYRFISKQYLLRKIDKEIQSLDSTFSKSDVSAEIMFYKFLYDNYDKTHIVRSENMMKLGEIKHLLYKLQSQDFFIP
jgi:hypothetical protein